MCNSIKILAILFITLVSKAHAGYVDYTDLTIKSIEYKSFSTSNGFMLTLDGIPENTGCSGTDTLKAMGRWETDTTSEYYRKGTSTLYSTALMAYSLNKKIDIKIHDSLCSTTSGLFIFYITVKD